MPLTINTFMTTYTPMAWILSLLFLAQGLPTELQAQEIHFRAGASSEKNHENEINEVQGRIKSWPALMRDALLAERAELVFMDDGSIPYENDGRRFTSSEDLLPSKKIREEAKFIGTDGRTHLWCAEGRDIQSKKKNLYQEWRDVRRAMAELGEKKVLAAFSKELNVMKQKFADKDKSAADLQKEKLQRQQAARNAGKEAEGILKVMQEKMESGARMAVLACLMGKVSSHDALNYTYANSKGELCFVYNQLQHDKCLNEALQILEKVALADEIGKKVVSKQDKIAKALQKGAKLRAQRMKATLKQYDACQAEFKGHGGVNRDKRKLVDISKAACDMVAQVQDPTCKAALLCIASDGLSPKELFTKEVVDSQNVPHSCYDALSDAGMVEQALCLIRDIQEHRGLDKALVNAFSKECDNQKSARRKRADSIAMAAQDDGLQADQEDGADSIQRQIEQSDKNFEEIKRAWNLLAKWPQAQRDTILAEQAGLLFRKDTKDPHEYYIGSDGQTYAWLEARDQVMASKTGDGDEDEWTIVNDALRQHGALSVLGRFSEEVGLLGQKFDNRNKRSASAQGAASQNQLSSADAEKEAGILFKTMQEEMKEQARIAVLACLIEDLSLQDALHHSYAGGIYVYFVYEDLVLGNCLEKAMQVLDKAASSPEIRRLLLSKYEKDCKSLYRWRGSRLLRMAPNKAHYAEALTKMQRDYRHASNEEALEKMVSLIDRVQDRSCRTALLQLASGKFFPAQDNLDCIVFDSSNNARTCYDVLQEGNTLTETTNLITHLNFYMCLSRDLKKHYKEEYDKMDKQLEEREDKIRQALKQHQEQQGE